MMHTAPAALIVAVLAGLLVFRKTRGAADFTPIERLLAALLPAGVIALAAVFIEFKSVAQWLFSNARLAAALAPLHGASLYATADHGTINDWIYGPVAPILWWPAGLATTPSAALAIAETINLLLLLVPLALVCFWSAGPGAQGGLRAAWGAIAAGAAMLWLYPTWYLAASLSSDNAAVGFGLLSCGVLACPTLSHRRLAAAAWLAAAAIWAKQIEAPLAVAQVLALLLSHGWKTAARYALHTGAALVVLGGIFALMFGGEAMWFSMWTVPTHQSFPDAGKNVGQLLLYFAQVTTPFWLLCLGLAWRQPGGWRRFVQAPFPLSCLLAALVLLPTGLLAATKVGGDRNSLHSVYYLVAAAAMLLTRLGQARQRWFLPAWAGAAILSLLAAAREVSVYPAGNPPFARARSDMAYVFAREHPGQAYFPCDPLATLLADGKAYHFEYGVQDWIFASYRPSPAHLKAGLPANLTFIVYPHGMDTLVLREIGGFDLVGVTPYWRVYARAGTAPAKVSPP